MISLRMVGTEVSALGAAALSMPLRFVLDHERLDPSAPHPPLVLVHGFLGDPTNFLVLRRYLAARGIRSFTSFSYSPRIDYQRLACRLGDTIETVRVTTGAAAVDVVGHSLGGLVARYLVEMTPDAPVRRLVSLGSPYFASPFPSRELAIYGAADPFIPVPHPVYGPSSLARRTQTVVVPECGHWGLLYHPAVMREIADFLGTTLGGFSHAPLALEAAS
jgi:pimeloyl-ACP methyl ester carboxylesterase